MSVSTRVSRFRSLRLPAVVALVSACAIAAVGVASAQSDAGPSAFVPQAPVRLVDTREGLGGTTLGAGELLDVPIAGVADVPDDATGAMFNVTVVGGTQRSYLTAWPSGQDRPLASNVNWVDDRPYPNLVSTALGDNGAVSLYIGEGTANVIVDLAGYYVGSAGTSLPGPQGPAGPQGETGAVGPQGDTGAPGTFLVVDANDDPVNGRFLGLDDRGTGARMLNDEGYGIQWDLQTGSPQAAYAEEVFESTDCTGPSLYDLAATGAPAVPFILFTLDIPTPGSSTLYRPGTFDLTFDVGSRFELGVAGCSTNNTGTRIAFDVVEYRTLPEVRPAPMTIVADN